MHLKKSCEDIETLVPGLGAFICANAILLDRLSHEAELL
jgi:hypothetical protein